MYKFIFEFDDVYGADGWERVEMGHRSENLRIYELCDLPKHEPRWDFEDSNVAPYIDTVLYIYVV